MARGSTLNVSLTSSLDRYVRDKVAGGGYESASEVIRESLRLSQTLEQTQDLFWTTARKKLAVAGRQISQGDTVDDSAEMQKILAEISDSPTKPKKRKR